MEHNITRSGAIEFCFNELITVTNKREYEKIYKNCVIGGEIKETQINRRFYCNKEELITWKQKREASKITLNKEDYLECLRFALKSFYSSASHADFGGAFQRDLGKYITDHVSGKLGEIALRKFLHNNYYVDIGLDFDVHGTITSQDITRVKKRKNKPEVWNNPNIKVSIKTTKLKNYLLIISENEYNLDDRKSDYYVFVRVDLPSDHLLRLLRDIKDFKEIKNFIAEFKDIDAYLTGFCKREDLEGPATELPGLTNISGKRYYKRSGDLSDNWQEFVNIL